MGFYTSIIAGFAIAFESENIKPITPVPGPAQRQSPGMTNFHPSALARHPVTSDWYILSSVSQVLLVAGGNMEIKRAIPLDRKLFEQPEGIAFSCIGTLYISSEKGIKTQSGLLKWGKGNRLTMDEPGRPV